MRSTVGNYRTENIVTRGLVLYLDAGNPNSYYGPSNSLVWKDLSGNANNGTLVNGPTFNDGAFVFDGVDDYVSFTPNVLLSYSINFTISTWIRLNSINKLQNIFGKSSGGSINDIWQILSVSSGNKALYRTRINSSTTADINGLITLLLGDFYNIVVTIDNNIGKIYINGILDISTNTQSFSLGTVNGVSLGRFPNVNAQFLSGNVYSLNYYNRALSPTEVLQNYNATKSRFGL